MAPRMVINLLLSSCVVILCFLSVSVTSENFEDSDFVKNLVENTTKLENEVVSYEKNYCEDKELENWQAPYNISTKFPYYHAGFDEENRPIWIIEFGRWDVRSMVEKGESHVKALEKYARQTCYRAFESIKNSKTPDFPDGEGALIIDAEGMDINQLYSLQTIALALKLAREYQFLLLGHLGSVIIINANHVFTVAIRIMRPVLGEIFNRLEVFGNNKARWVPELLSRFPKDQLPEWYGGSKKFKPVAVYG